MKADLPLCETERLAYLHRLDILDTPREESFDDIAQLAGNICETPIAMVSLVAKDRQWFKSCVGLSATETPRDVAFCAHAILHPEELLIVEDARLDPRFTDNPMVVGEPYIRFYAGAPLVAQNGLPLGTLCVVDYTPRQLTTVQIQTLKLLAKQVVQLLQSHEVNLVLEQERQKLDDVIKGANLGTWHWNVQTGELVLNERWARIIGYKLAELGPLSLDTWKRQVHPEDWTNAIGLLEQHFSGDLDFFECQSRMKHKDGRWITVLARGRLISTTGTGKPLWMSGTLGDISSVEEARKLIAANEEKLSTLYSQAPVAIVLNNFSDGRFLDCNPEFARVIGYGLGEILSMTYSNVTPEEYRESDKRELEHLLETGRYGPYEKQLIHKSGRLIPVLMNGVLITTQAGGKHIWTFIQDITERKRIEQMKNEFVSAVSHELRTPLTSISGSLGLIASGMLGELPAKVQNMLSIAHKNSQRLTVLINDLLDMEKILAGKMIFDMQEQPLLPILQSSLESNKAYADTFGINLVLNNEGEDLRGYIDARRLQQVLANFISNAIKFSPEGGQVDVVLSRQGDYAKIAVIDRGPGISEEFRARIFQKFSQADSSDSRQRGGTGLGLAISKALVEKMHGSIGFESEVGKGATFFALFPIQRPDIS